MCECVEVNKGCEGLECRWWGRIDAGISRGHENGASSSNPQKKVKRCVYCLVVK